MTDSHEDPEHTLFLEDPYQARRAKGQEAERARQLAELERLQADEDRQDPAARSRQLHARALTRARQPRSK